MTRELLNAITALASMPADLADGVARNLRSLAAHADPIGIESVMAVLSPRWRDPVRQVIAIATTAHPRISLDAVAFALQAAVAARAAVCGQQEVELVWTGPIVVQSTFRRTDRAWVDVIDSARSSLWLVSFSVGSITRIQQSLLAALDRGVVVRMLFESVSDSGGALSYDGFASFDRRLLDRAHLLGWATSRRDHAPNGTIALMHAKAVVADSHTMFVTSANLSGAALERNLEVGVIVRGGAQPGWLQERFDALLERGLIERRSLA